MSTATPLYHRAHRKVIILDPQLSKLSEYCTDRARAVLAVNDVLDDLEWQKRQIGRNTAPAHSVWNYLFKKVDWDNTNVNGLNESDANISIK